MLLQAHRILTEQLDGRMPTKWRERIDIFIFMPDGKMLVGYNPLFKTLLSPGGGVEEGQTLKTAAENECLEELGARIKNWKAIPGATFNWDYYKHTPEEARNHPKMKERMKIYRGIKIHFSRADFDAWDKSLYGRDADAKMLISLAMPFPLSRRIRPYMTS